MNIKKQIGVAVTTCSSKETASRIVNNLLKANLIACGQIEGPIESIYPWEGKLETESEWKISLKFDLDKQVELQQAVEKMHPYDVPQWIVWEAGTSEGYYDWLVNPD